MVSSLVNVSESVYTSVTIKGLTSSFSALCDPSQECCYYLLWGRVCVHFTDASSALRHLEHCLGKPSPLDLNLRGSVFDFLQIVGREFNLRCAEVLLKPV